MDINDALALGQDVKIGTPKSGGLKYDGQVRKIKENLVAIALANFPNKEEAAPGCKVMIAWAGKAGAFKAKGEVIQDKTYPIVVVRVGEIVQSQEEEKEEKEEKEEEVHQADYDKDFDRKYVKKSQESEAEIQRESARVEDAFPIQFFIVEKETVEQKKKDYLVRRTRDRREDSKTSTNFSESEIITKLSNADPRVAAVILDLYHKYTTLAARIIKKEIKGGGEENSATCVDLSGSGLQFLTKQQIKPGTVFKFIANPPASPPFSVSALGEVMRVELKKDPLDRKMKYAYGCRFVAIHEDDKEELIQYTFKRQQEMLKMRRKMADYE
jgi:hypothetical protein